MDGTTEACGRALVRSGIYSLLARALSGPDGALDRKGLEDLLGLLEEDGPYASLAPRARAAVEAVGTLASDPRSVAKEYTGLFQKGNAPPYEGSYLSSFRATQELADVGGFFRAFGTQVRGERPDHLVSELELMSLLCLKEALARGNGQAEAADICRDAEAKFLRDHLGRWVPAYADQLRAQARLPIFPILVDLVEGVVGRDAESLHVAPERIQEVAPPDGDEPPRCGVAR
ncbi:MAG: hypothetical protein A3K59_06725 [Euryarchaeota archaeon RBG_19FT_COMBO_69_17]|nr:MAG: hypothetical protein A3K59_06725 [Euryarchaeota archaeon RBG_19FT_COMBO_69_17]